MTAHTNPLPPELRSARARFRLELEDGSTRDLWLRDGRVSPAEGDGAPDATLVHVPADWESLFDGRLNLLTAVMRGDVEVRGDLTAAFFLHLYGRHAGARESAA